MRKWLPVILTVFLLHLQNVYTEPYRGNPHFPLSGHSVSQVKMREVLKQLKMPGVVPGMMHNSMHRRGIGWNMENFTVLTGIQNVIEPEYISFPAWEGYIPITVSFKTLSEFELWDGWRQLTYEYDYEIDSMDLYGRLSTFIDKNGYLTRSISRYEYEEDMKVCMDDVFEYTAEGNLDRKTTLSMVLYDSTWDTSSSRFEYTYQNDKITEAKVFSLETDSSWVEYEKYVYTYTAEGKLSEVINWWQLNGEWSLVSRNVYTYDNSGRQLECVLEDWNESDSIWEIDQKGEYTYNADGTLSMFYTVEWYGGSDTLASEYKYGYSYASEGEYKEIIGVCREYGDSSWQNYLKCIFEYDTKGNINDMELFSEGSGDDDWYPELKYSFTYNSHGNPEEMDGFTWDTVDQTWQNDAEYILTFNYSYSNAIDLNPVALSGRQAVTVWRNRGSLCAAVEGKPADHDIMRVYDCRGRLIRSVAPMRQQNRTLFSWDIAGSAPADKVYILSIMHNSTQIERKIILYR